MSTVTTEAPVAAGPLSISPRDYTRLSEFIYATCGIKLPPAKKTMLEARLQRRVRELGLPSFKAYCDQMIGGSAAPDELIRMIDLVTTNKTDFFREPHHFEYLVQDALPELTLRTGAGRGRDLRVWSAGCSTGEEPYTLAMVLAEYAEAHGLRFSVTATDISTRVLKAAAAAIYEEEKVQPVPVALKRKYLLRSRDRTQTRVRIAPEIRARIQFRRLNFMDTEFGLPEAFDVVFCRNVIIYFDRPTQEAVLGKIGRNMHPGAYLFTGHSETLFGLSVPFESVAPTVYRRR